MLNTVTTSKPLSEIPLVESQLVFHKEAAGTTLYFDMDLHEDNRLIRVPIGGSGDSGHVPILQTPVTVTSKEAAFNYCPEDMNVYILADCTFSSEQPGGSSLPFLVIIRKTMKELVAIGRKHIFTSYKEGNSWSAWSMNIRTIQSWDNLTLEGAKTSMTTYPSHTEILRAKIVEEDNPRPDLGDTWYLDCRAWDAEHFTTIVQGYGEEYINQRTQIGVDEHGAPVYGWVGWKSTNEKVSRYFESTAQTNQDWSTIESYIITHIEDYNNVLYTLTYGSLSFTAAVSPTASASTVYQLECEKMSDHSLFVKATILNGGTAEYPIGTSFYCTVSEDLTQSEWQVISSNSGLIEVTTKFTNVTRDDILAQAETAADRDTFSVVFDSVVFTDAEAPITPVVCYVEVIKTIDRTFMRASTRVSSGSAYYNKIYYCTKVSGSWTAWTINSAPLLGDVSKTTTINEDSTDNEIPTAAAVYTLVGDIEAILHAINEGV